MIRVSSFSKKISGQSYGSQRSRITWERERGDRSAQVTALSHATARRCGRRAESGAAPRFVEGYDPESIVPYKVQSGNRWRFARLAR